MARLRTLLSAVLMWLWAGQVHASYQTVGQGEAHWFGIHLYSATLSAPGGQYAAEAPFALSLEYQRDIRGEDIINTSLKEMRRLGADAQALARWERDLQRLIRDVSPGTRLTGEHRPGQGTLFQRDGQALGGIADPAFAHYFFAIWLSPQARDASLRNQLLGKEQSP